MNRVMLGVIVLTLVFFLAFVSVNIIGKLVPYDPLVVNSYKFKEREACPGDLVDLETDRYVDSNFTVDTIHVESYWQVEDDPRPYIPYSYDLSATELRNTEGAALRLAPFTGGEWTITTEFTIEGTVLGFVPREQNLTVQTSNSLVIPEDNTECKLSQTSDRT